jgi:glyoxylase-like metal-dependent hydrolase (beta-lactamase superfamily II)
MIKKISKEVTQINFNNFGSIVYLIELPGNKILIDTSSKENSEKLLSSLFLLKILPKDINTIILSHAHYDHTENINLFLNAKVYGNFKKIIEKDHSEKEEKRIIPIEKFPLKEFKIFKTPGHTEGDIVLLYKNILFSGDIIFHNGYIGRTDFPESIPKKMQTSLEFIKKLNFEILCPGH